MRGGRGEHSGREGASHRMPGKAGKWGGSGWAGSEEEAESSTSPCAALSRGTGALVCRVEGWGPVEASLVFGGTARLLVVTGFKEEERETNTIAKCHMTAFSMLVLTSHAPLSDGESDVIFPNFGLEAGVGPTPLPCGKGNALGFTPSCLLPRKPLHVVIVPGRLPGPG